MQQDATFGKSDSASDRSRTSNPVSLTARQYIAGSVLATLLDRAERLDEADIDECVRDASYITNRMLAELDRGRKEHMRRKADREARDEQ